MTAVMSAPHPFESLVSQHADRVLFKCDDGRQFRYADVLALSRQPALQQTRRRLVLCMLDNVPGALLGYLALTVGNAVPMNVGASLPTHRLTELLALYRPDFVWLPDGRVADLGAVEVRLRHEGHSLVALGSAQSASLHSDLALLLSTSGSTGSARFVRLSHRNVASNAESIAQYLQLAEDDCPITSLPPHYTYGLSVIHSHLVVGGAIALTDKTLFDREFWAFMKSAGVSSFSGVPYHYEMLKKLRFWRQGLPSLRLLTQAGGRMDPAAALEMAQESDKRGIRYITMYGQVEATARMAYLSHEAAISKAGSIGRAIPGGAFRLEDDQAQPIKGPDVCGLLVYQGPNVSMGYAEGWQDLSREDDNQGVLRTGDLARRDADGDYYIVGRQKRFLKLFGHRVNLEDVEQALRRAGHEAACSGQDDHLKVYVAGASADVGSGIRSQLVEQLKVHPSAVSVLGLAHLPRSESGKLLYPELDTLPSVVLA